MSHLLLPLRVNKCTLGRRPSVSLDGAPLRAVFHWRSPRRKELGHQAGQNGAAEAHNALLPSDAASAACRSFLKLASCRRSTSLFFLLTNDFHSYRPERDVLAAFFRFGCIRKCHFKLQTQRENFSSGGRERRTSEETFHSDSIRTRRSLLGLKYPFDTSWRLNNTRLEPNNDVPAACRDQRP